MKVRASVKRICDKCKIVPTRRRAATAPRGRDRRPAPGRNSDQSDPRRGPSPSAPRPTAAAAGQRLGDRRRYLRAGTGTSLAVRIHGPVAITATVCSKCADSEPSIVRPSTGPPTFPAAAGVHHRLDRQRQARVELRPRPALRSSDLRLFVEPTGRCRGRRIAHHRKPDASTCCCTAAPMSEPDCPARRVDPRASECSVTLEQRCASSEPGRPPPSIAQSLK